MRSRACAGVLLLAVAAGACAETLERFASSSSGANLFCYDCDDAAWNSLEGISESALADFKAAAPENIAINLNYNGQPPELPQRLQLTKFEYILAPSLDDIPRGVAVSGAVANGVVGVSKAFHLRLYDARAVSGGIPTDIYCQRYLFVGDKRTEIYVTVKLIGQVQSSGKLSPSELMTNAALVCLGGALDSSVTNNRTYSMQFSELAGFAHMTLLGAASAANN